jgi:hypothetical protein
MKYHPDDLSDHSIPSWDLYSRLLTRLEHLQNLFLLERLLIKQGHATAQDLVDVSIEMLSLTSGIWKERERLMCVSGDFEWLVCLLFSYLLFSLYSISPTGLSMIRSLVCMAVFHDLPTPIHWEK